MVRVLTGAQVAEERAHEQYIEHLHLKPSSYKFYYRSYPTESQLRKGGPWGLVRFSDTVWNGQCSFNTTKGVRCCRRTVFGVGYCWQHLEDKRHLRIGPSLILKSKVDRSGNVVRDIHNRIVKESIGRGVFADDPSKPRDAIVFKKDQRVMLYEGEVTDDTEAKHRYGVHTNPYSLQASQEVFNSKTNRHYSRRILNAPIIDASLLRGVGSLVNHKPHNQANVYFDCAKPTPNNNNKWVYKVIAKRDIRNGEELYVDYGGSYGDFRSGHFPRFDTVSNRIKNPTWY